MTAKRTFFSLIFLFLAFFCIVGCNEGTEIVAVSNTVGTGLLSPTIASLTVSGNKLSIANGGILKLSCYWTSNYTVSSATAFLMFVQSLNDPVYGPTGVISSGTATTTTKLILPIHSAIFAATTATSTSTSTSTSTATTTTTVATATLPWFFTNITNPMTIPTGIATTQKEGVWSVEIPFPSAILKNTATGKIQAMLWMVMNERKTNTLAFEMDISE